MASAYTQIQNSIVVTTDKSSYSDGEIVRIAGEVGDIYSGTPVSVIILHPDGSTVSLSQVAVGPDKKFSTEITVGGPLMDVVGSYTIVAQYGNESRSAEVSFGYKGPANEIGMSITAIAEKGSDTIMVIGKTDSDVTDVTLIVTSPSGDYTMAVWQVSPDDDGEFIVEFLVGPAWEEDGFYEIEAIQAGSTNSLYTISVLVEVTSSMTEETIVTEFDFEPEIFFSEPTIFLTTNLPDYGNGDIVIISGNIKNYYSLSGGKLSYIIKSPIDYILDIGQLSLRSDGTFEYIFTAGGPLWKSSGDYIVEFNFGASSGKTTIVYTGGEFNEPILSSGTDVMIPTGTGDPGCEDTLSCYDPYRITVEKYSTVTWYNADEIIHTVTSGTPVNGPDGAFDSGTFATRDSYSYKFDRAGTYNYFCMVHPWMLGQVVVTGDGVDKSLTYDTTPPKILKPTDITAVAENQNGARVSYEVLAIDETNQIVRPSCSPSSGSLFGVGTTRVTCNAMDSSGNRASAVSFSVTVNPPEIVIPNWVKNVAEFWCSNKIQDRAFIEGIQYLIDNNIIIVSAEQSVSGSTQEIPNWVKNNACWWSVGLITDNDFGSGIEFLVKQGIIRV